MTGWYGAATTELPPAAWSAEADVGAERRNQVPLSRSIAMSRGQTPRPRHDGPLLTGGGLAQTKRRGGCRADSCGHAATGEPPGIDEASEPWRVALQAGPGAFTSSGRADEPQRWQARRAETVLAATVGHRHARAAALDGKRKGVKGTLAALAAAPPVSRNETTDRPSALSYPTPAPGPRCGPGARSIHASASVRSGGSQDSSRCAVWVGSRRDAARGVAAAPDSRHPGSGGCQARSR